MGEIPTRYEIVREHYTLTLSVSPGSWDAAIAVQITSPGEHQIRARNKTNHKLNPCVKWTTYNQAVTWVYGFYRCNDPTPWKHLDNHLRFDVLDRDGTVVVETIPYTVKRDGFFGYFDAI